MILGHFGYPHPQLDQWQQCTWYDLGAVQDLLHHMRNRLAKGLPAVASPPRSGPHNSPLLPTSMAPRPNRGSILVKASRGGGLAQDTATTGPPTSGQNHLLKQREKGGGRRSERSPNALSPVKPYHQLRRNQKYSLSLLTPKLKVPSGIQIVPSVHPRAHLTRFNNKSYTPPCYILIKHDSNFPYVPLLAPLDLSALYIYWALNNFKTP